MKKVLDYLQRNKKLISIIGCCLIGLVAVGFFFSNKGKGGLNAEQIIVKMKKESSLVNNIKEYKVIDGAQDDNLGLIYQDNMYISKITFEDLNTKDSGGAIYVFNNSADLLSFLTYFDTINEEISNLASVEQYGQLINKNIENATLSRGYYYQNALLVVDESIDENSKELYETAFTNVLKEVTYPQKKLPDEQMTKQVESNLKLLAIEKAAEVKEYLQEYLDAIILEVTTRIEKAEATPTQKEITSLTEYIENFNAPYFSEKYTNWKDRINAMQSALDAKVAAEAAEKQRKEELKKNTHTAGTYKVGTDIAAGEYILVGSGYFEIASNSNGKLESIIANDNFEKNSIVTVEDGQYLKVSRATFYPADMAPTLSTRGEGMFKIGVHLPAGEYKLKATSTTMGYYEVTSNSKHTLYSIVANDNFSGETYITVSEGQYLKLSRCIIVQ